MGVFVEKLPTCSRAFPFWTSAMFEKFLRANAQDFRQRYEGTYGFYRDEKGKRMLAQLTGITEDVCLFVDARGLEYRLNVDAEKDIGFEFLPPRSGYFNTKRGAMLVKRIAARQFQRGVTGKNVTILLLIAASLQLQRMGFSLLESVYEKNVSAKEALAMFQSLETPSVAISSSFGLDNAGVVWVLDEAIGTHTREGNTYKIKLNEKCPFKTELTDAFKALAVQATVV
jgi:hypothetical protein